MDSNVLHGFKFVSNWFKTVWNGFSWKCSPRDILPVCLAWVYFPKWFHFLTCNLHLFSPFYFLFWIGQINQSCHCQIGGFCHFTVKEVTVSIANDNRDMMILILILITTISMNLDTVINRVQVLISSWYEAMTDYSNDVIWHDDDNDNDDDDDGNLVRRKGGTKDLTTRCWKTEHQPMTLIIIVIIIMIMMMIIDDHHNCDDDDDVVTSGRAWSHPCYPKYEIWAKICCMIDDDGAPPVLPAKEGLHPPLPAWPGPRRLGADTRLSNYAHAYVYTGCFFHWYPL